MQAYLIKRLLLIIPTLLFVSLIVFFAVRFVPGSAIDVIQAGLSSAGSGIDRAAIEHALGLDVPVYVQYFRWLGDIVLHGDLGDSIIQGTPVLQIIAHRIPVSLELGILALIISTAISLPIGIYSAMRQDSIGDYVSRIAAILMIAVPSFWIATLIVIYPAIWWDWSPSLEVVSFIENPLKNLGTFLLPAAIIGASTSGMTMRITRTMMLEVLRQDYLRTGWAKGLTERTIIIKHAIKNAFIPVITIIGSQAGMLIGGTVIIENIFSLPGIGALMIEALHSRDYPIVSATTLLVASFVVALNLIVDIAYSWLDPRIRYQ